MNKIKVSQEQLKIFFEGCHFVNAALAKKMGVSEGIVSDCFNHKLNRHGKPLTFSKANIERMNTALKQIAEELSDSKLTYADDGEATTKRFINDDPAVIDSLCKISEYIKLNWLTWKALGWNQKKCLNNINLSASNPHVHISRGDIDRINAELLSIAATLSSWEVVADDEGSAL